jgi:mannan endo-1,4-beta-mannosidase
MLDVKSSSKGFLPPRMTTEQRSSIQNPADGLTIYNSDLNCLEFYAGIANGWHCPCLSFGTISCLNTVVNGVCVAGIPMTTSNTVAITVSSTTTGGYNISTNTVNGFRFAKMGTFTTIGAQVILLNGSGTPVAADTTTFTVTYGASGCSLKVPVHQQSGMPNVSTIAVSNLTANSATSGGNVTSAGGATVTARGVCWGTSSNPTIAGSHTSNGTGTGIFPSIVSGLNANTTYHIRAYATNTVGTSYGNELIFTTSAAQRYIHTSGKYLLGPCDDTLLLKGVNYAPYNWGYDISSLEIAQIALSGANAVRMVWYSNNPDPYTNAVYGNFVALDSAISKCVQNKMIAVVEIHDYTCSTDTTGLLNLSTWWTQAGVFNILQKYKESVIINYANEALYFNWTSNPTAALATYKRTYQNIITALRSNAGFKFPIMIDAPDCGTNTDAFITSNVANSLIQFDPEHNLIFSAHTYWFAFANNDSAQMAAKINAVLAQNIPLVLGELANFQGDATPCQYALNYKPLLNYCQLKKVSWLSWCWDHDNCPARQISSNGNFSNLTTYGNDIVHNTGYGLLQVSAPKSQFFLNGCGTGQ